ncbi:MAG: metal ABC transporter ATP-binding protein [Planctomycetota bacterium]|jgi:ABC-type Mn2+/Zn2+ transport system ATPase subunit|nr:metal ABC transporter ATP-binding protein [Planctomycetota bacterium]
MIPPILSVRDLTLGYHDHLAVDKLSLAIGKGEFVQVAGRNGSGKSSLVKAVLGLIAPWSGTVTLDVPRDRVGYLAQGDGPDPSFPATVLEVALAGRQHLGKIIPFYTRRDREETLKALDSVGMGELSGRRIGELSGGQRRRALIARALAREPDLLILDEPLSGLDHDSEERLLALLDRLNREAGLTVMMTTHHPGLARRDSRVVALDGRLLYDGPASGWRDRASGGE